MRSLPGKTREEAIKKSLFIFCAAGIFLADRISKLVVIHFFSVGESFPLLPGFFHLTRVSNAGAAFGILKHQILFLNAVSLIFIGAFIVFFLQPYDCSKRILFWAWSLVFAGALGNLVDRLQFGYVIDFLDFRIWPVFNLADSSICIGVGLMMLQMFRKPSSDAS